MRRFAGGELDVLVATTVIEVGVDVPNATVMVVLDADRFGVSQLHQLRGPRRPGRRRGAVPAGHRRGAGDARAGAAATGSPPPSTASRWPGSTSSSGARATCSAPAQSGRRSSLRLLRLLRDEDAHRCGPRRRRPRSWPPTRRCPRTPALVAAVRPTLVDDRAGRLPREGVSRDPATASGARDRRGGAAAGGCRCRAAATRPTSDRAREGLFSALRVVLRVARTALGSSTCTPARARSGWRRCRAAPRRRCSSRATPSRWRRCAPTSRLLGLSGDRRSRRAGGAAAGAGAPPAALRRGASLDPPYGSTRRPGARAARRAAGWPPDAVVAVERATRDGAAGLAGRGSSRRADAALRRQPLSGTGRRCSPAMRRAVCPGSFDPVTCGHLDIIERASRALRRGRRRGRRQPGEEQACSRRRGADGAAPRGDRATAATSSVDTFAGLLVDFCKTRDIRVIVKGLRAVSDFDYELQMGQMNHSLAGVETLFIPTNPLYCFLSSSLVKEVATYGGDVSGLVPEAVLRRLREKLARLSRPDTRSPDGRPLVDVHAKLDELTALVENARAMPMSASCVVNRAEMLAHLDEVRGLLPSEIAGAQQVIDEQEAVVEAGREEAERIIEEARAERARLISRTDIVREATEEAEKVAGRRHRRRRPDAGRDRRLRRRQARQLRGRAAQDAPGGREGPGQDQWAARARRARGADGRRRPAPARLSARRFAPPSSRLDGRARLRDHRTLAPIEDEETNRHARSAYRLAPGPARSPGARHA